MDAVRTGVFLLLLVPVSCRDFLSIFHDPVVCYSLDGILIVYCIVITALFFKERFSSEPVEPEEKGRIYEELRRPEDTDPYQVLEPSKRRKNPRKKKKPVSTQPEQTDNETLITTA
ncbi:CD247 antigen like [Paralichthys olivaceus]|uniref:CD247 antigen like n=1 Tax=Paralichthys olivaceus TaxID=8255 RepID=UPI0037501D41